MSRLRPIRRSAKGLLPGGLKRRPANKTWRKGHRLKSGKWAPGIWVFRAGKRKVQAKKPRPITPIGAPKRKAKPRTKVKSKPSLVPRAKTKAKPKVRAKAQPQVPLTKAGPLTKEQIIRKRQLRRRSKARAAAAAKKAGKGFLPVREELARSRKESPAPKIMVRRKPWSSERKRRARLVAGHTGASVVQADALIRRAKSKGVAYDTVDWDRLQGRDLTFAGRVRRLNKMVGHTSTKREEAMDLAAKREDFREKREMKRRERRRKGEARPNTEHSARWNIEDELNRRAEQLERVMFGL